MAQETDWSDISMFPENGVRLTGLNAVNGAFFNLTALERRTVLFNPQIGIDFESFIHQPNDLGTELEIYTEMKSIEVWDPRDRVLPSSKITRDIESHSVYIDINLDIQGLYGKNARKMARLKFKYGSDE